MADLQAQYQLRFINSLEAIKQEDWNRLAGDSYPFIRHEFLLALERSGCVGPGSGWRPHHLLLYGADDQLDAIMPLYLKNNSLGEYVFDWSWADAYSQHGLRYYPKFVTSIPFTPSAGPRICIAPGLDEAPVTTAIVRGVKREAQTLGVSSWHLLFPKHDVGERLLSEGVSIRLGCQFQWFNDGFTDFDEFLQSFSSRKRKNIRKERRRVSESGIGFQRIEGPDITTEQWRTFYRFYQNTYLVRGRNPYLNLPFFLEIGRAMPRNLLLIMAERDGIPIAGALSFKDDETLYGRYWGCDRDSEFLHFETCYYQGIDYCLEHNLRRFDSGAQGEHKIQRGFRPVPTYSNHWIADSRFREAINEFLEQEAHYIRQYMDQAGTYLPFKQTLSLDS